MRRGYDWQAEASRIESFGMFLTTLCGSCSAAKTNAPGPNCRETNNHSSEHCAHGMHHNAFHCASCADELRSA